MNLNATVPLRHLVLLTLLCWLSMIGFDFLLHGGILATFYVQPSPFLLPLEKAFRLIPLGYLSYLLLAVLLVWLMRRLDIRGWKDGLIFALKLGALVWGAMVLGLVSISTASDGLLVGWFFGQTIELGVAGMFAGSGLGGARLTRLLIIVIALIFLSLSITVVLQSTGIAPTLRAGGVGVTQQIVGRERRERITQGAKGKGPREKISRRRVNSDVGLRSSTSREAAACNSPGRQPGVRDA